MSFIDHEAREINLKIVYWGPGLAGRTTNIQYIWNRTRPEARGELISLATDAERTLSTSFVAQTFGEVGGLRPRFHLHTAPGTVFYDATRRTILQGVDGVVFVADSQASRLAANIQWREELETNLAMHGRVMERTALVLQYNKRDLPGVMPVAALSAALNPLQVAEFEAVATQGIGVFDTLRTIARQLLAEPRGER